MNNYINIVIDGRKREENGDCLFEKLLQELDEVGIDIKKIRSEIMKIKISAYDKERSLSVGLSRYDNDAIMKLSKQFFSEQKEFNSKINTLMSSLEYDLKAYLPLDLAGLGTRYSTSLLRKVRRIYNRSIFYKIFKPLLDAEYAGGQNPFKNDKEFFKYVLRHLNPNDYLRPIPLKSASKIWREPIINVYDLVYPKMSSKNKAYKIVARLFFYVYPNSFLGDFDSTDALKKHAEKVRRVVEKSVSPTPEV